jgi:hypothetical protein
MSDIPSSQQISNLFMNFHVTWYKYNATEYHPTPHHLSIFFKFPTINNTKMVAMQTSEVGVTLEPLNMGF